MITVWVWLWVFNSPLRSFRCTWVKSTLAKQSYPTISLQKVVVELAKLTFQAVQMIAQASALLTVYRCEFMVIAYFIAYFWEIKVLTSLYRYASDIIFFDDLRGKFWPTWTDHLFQGIKERLGKGNIFYNLLNSGRNSYEHNFIICFSKVFVNFNISLFYTVGKLLILTLYLL